MIDILINILLGLAILLLFFLTSLGLTALMVYGYWWVVIIPVLGLCAYAFGRVARETFWG